MTANAPISAGPKKLPLAESLLARVYAPDTASSTYLESIVRRPLHLRPTSAEDASLDARERRQRAREAKRLEARRCNRKPKPLSAAQKRKLCLYDVPRQQQKWQNFVGLNTLWLGYIRDVLGWSGRQTIAKVDARAVGPLIASADLHGAELEVVQSRCVGRVGICGIVIKDTKETFSIITRSNKVKVVPKEFTAFRLRIPLSRCDAQKEPELPSAVQASDMVMVELQGSQFAQRPAERATKKIKLHLPPDI